MRTAVFLFILLHGAALTGADLHVETPMVQVVHSSDKLREVCRVDGHYDACTIIVAFRLEPACVEVPGQWKLKATARYRPWIFLGNLSRLSHEHEHLQDLLESVAAHLAELERLGFETKTDCQTRALIESGTFGASLRAFAVRSNLEHHPRLALRQPTDTAARPRSFAP